MTRLLFLVIAIIALVSCSGPGEKTILLTIITEAGSPDYTNGQSWRFPQSSYILSVNPENPGKDPVNLTAGFAAAAFPEVSYDGTKMIFAGKIKTEDPWQIFEMNLSGKKYRQLTSTGINCTDPAYLPGDRFVFVMALENDTTGLCHSVFASDIEGGNPSRLTWHPHADFAPTVMADGRILSITRQLYPETGKSQLFIMRPDGTKAMLYIPSGEGEEFISQPAETSDGRMYYITKETESGIARLWSLKVSRPLHTSECIDKTDEMTYSSVAAGMGDILYVACAKKGESVNSLCEFDKEAARPGKTLFTTEKGFIAEVTVAEVHPRPKKLPSEVDMLVKTGQMMCQDINLFGEGTDSRLKAARIEIIGVGKSLGTVDVEPDGSFYLKPIADMPFRIRTVDEKGNSLNGPTGWMWLRPNERRGCVGCHEDPETVPENRLPMAVRKNPVLIPVHLEKVKEKSVELE